MTLLARAIEALRALLKRLRRLFGGHAGSGKHSLVFVRLFWGALAGCLIAVFFADSPLLENLELSMLSWRYKTADQLTAKTGSARTSKDISIVAFDDSSQFDLGVARFTDAESQQRLAEVLETIESGDPTLVAVDFNLHGAADPELVRVFQRYRNVVLAVFGSLEGNDDLPDAAFLKHAIGYGYDELLHENNGQVLRLPITPTGPSKEASDMAPVPSFTEAIMSAYRQMKGLSPNDQLRNIPADQPVYINFKRTDYPLYSMSALIEPKFNSDCFKNRIVIVAPTLTPKRQELGHVATPVRGKTPEVYAHADALSTILNGEMIYSYPKAIARHIMILLAATFGAACSLLSHARRVTFAVCGGTALVLVAQMVFELWHVALPVVPPLAMLLSGLIAGTVIYLDTDLRVRNRELATAREHMQVRAEEERKRIAGDLHDETLPALSSVARMIDELYKVDDPNKSSVPEKMRLKIDATIQEMRRVINDLHPSVLETMGFVPALDNLGVMLSRDSGIDYSFVDRNEQDDYEISDFAKLQLYRIVQEALNNVGKHSQATRVEMKLQTHDGSLEISVADDGKGINPKLIRRDSHGLLNIRHRAQLIGATVEWRKPQAFHQGTEIRVSVPVATENKNGSTIEAPQLQKGAEKA